MTESDITPEQVTRILSAVIKYSAKRARDGDEGAISWLRSRNFDVAAHLALVDPDAIRAGLKQHGVI